MGNPVMARRSTGPPYECEFEWDCFVQCGDRGVVFKNLKITDIADDPGKVLDGYERALKGDEEVGYVTSFFEAFPLDPQTFIRAEGKTISEAERAAWDKLKKYRECSHEQGFERRGYKNGGGFCRGCGYFKAGAFPAEPGYWIASPNVAHTTVKMKVRDLRGLSIESRARVRYGEDAPTTSGDDVVRCSCGVLMVYNEDAELFYCQQCGESFEPRDRRWADIRGLLG